MLVLAALLEPKENWTTTLLAQLSSFSYAHHAAIRVYSQSGTSPPESSTVDINHAYIAIKLWILLAQKVTAHGNGGDARVFGVWNELWPPFEGLVNAFEAEASSSQSLVSGQVEAFCNWPMVIYTTDSGSAGDIIHGRPFRIFANSAHSNYAAHFNSYCDSEPSTEPWTRRNRHRKGEFL